VQPRSTDVNPRSKIRTLRNDDGGCLSRLDGKAEAGEVYNFTILISVIVSSTRGSSAR
jgi:hypothetical protein